MCLDGLREGSNRGGCQVVEAEQIAEAGPRCTGSIRSDGSGSSTVRTETTAGPVGVGCRKGLLYSRERGRLPLSRQSDRAWLKKSRASICCARALGFRPHVGVGVDARYFLNFCKEGLHQSQIWRREGTSHDCCFLFCGIGSRICRPASIFQAGVHRHKHGTIHL